MNSKPYEKYTVDRIQAVYEEVKPLKKKIDNINANRKERTSIDDLAEKFRYINGKPISSSLNVENRTFGSNQKNEIWERSNRRCQICNVELSPFSGLPNSFEADHIVPFSKNGKTSLQNGQALCRECNRKKSNSL